MCCIPCHIGIWSGSISSYREALVTQAKQAFWEPFSLTTKFQAPCRYLMSPLWKQDPTGFVGSDFHRRVSQGIRAYPCHNLPHEFAPYHPQFGCIACWCFWSPIFIPFAEINRKEPSSLFHIVPKQQWAILSRLPQPGPFAKNKSSRCSKEWTRNIALIDSKLKEYEKGCGLPLQQCKPNGPKIEQYDHCSFRTAVRAHGGHG